MVEVLVEELLEQPTNAVNPRAMVNRMSFFIRPHYGGTIPGIERKIIENMCSLRGLTLGSKRVHLTQNSEKGPVQNSLHVSPKSQFLNTTVTNGIQLFPAERAFAAGGTKISETIREEIFQ